MAWDTWTATNGDWSTPSNWSTVTVPAPYDVVYATSGQISATGIDTTGDYIWLDTTGGGHLTLTLTDASLGVGSLTLLQGSDSEIDLRNTTMSGTVLDDWGDAAITVDAGTYTANYGTIEVSAAVPSTLILVANGTFTNFGMISGGQNATDLIDFRSNYLFNTGTVKADAGSYVALTSLTPYATSYGEVFNTGSLEVNGGSMAINADLFQTAGAGADVTDNGILTLNGMATGGTIRIQSGMLNFTAAAFIPIPFASSHFTSTLDLAGSSASIVFGGATDLTAVFREATNDLLVTEPFRGSTAQVADLKLAGSHYSAADFAVNGNIVTYTAHSS